MLVDDPRVQLILDAVDEAVADFLYHDRNFDLDVPRGEIEAAVAAGNISVDDIVDEFRRVLMERLKA